MGSHTAKASEQLLLDVQHVDKRYGGVHALKDVSFQVRAGEVHGLVGENGAGKSTLIKMISGAERPDSGEITLLGEPIELGNTVKALEAGISPVYQEPQLFADLTVEENIFLGREHTRAGRVKWNEQHEKVIGLLTDLRLRPEAIQERVGDLSVGEQQLVSIAKAFVTDVKLLILDEPSAILANSDVDRLFDIIRTFTARGIGVIYISHRLDELGEITDRITVLRDGSRIGTYDTHSLTTNEIATLMVGDKFQVEHRDRDQGKKKSEIAVSVRDMRAGKRLASASFNIRRGEILGIYGLIGSGTTEVIRALYGIEPASSGEIEINGKPVTIRSPQAAMRHSITMLPGNRKAQGVFLPKSLSFNLSSSHLGYFSRLGIFNFGKEKRAMEEAIQRLRIKTRGPHALINELSGGNQQKVVMARQFVQDPYLLLVEEPTQGVDVGAKAEIHSLILEHAAQGNAVLVVSTDLEEIRYLCDRIVVLHNGVSARELPGDCSAAELLAAASGESTAKDPAGGVE
ncbi:sugar ABC transporter ATP-binding protein [Trueperella sp. LYQ143]|uniref:sugar ABC transporter ATP-binding protein n=1 Tax=Trueperella sp. LYQ143 TaxID=3391059 RepID=UPI003983C913